MIVVNSSLVSFKFFPWMDFFCDPHFAKMSVEKFLQNGDWSIPIGNGTIPKFQLRVIKMECMIGLFY